MGALDDSGRAVEPIAPVGTAAAGPVDPCRHGRFTPVMGCLGLPRRRNGRATRPSAPGFYRRTCQLQSDTPVSRRIELGPTQEPQTNGAGWRGEQRRCCASSISRGNVA